MKAEDWGLKNTSASALSILGKGNAGGEASRPRLGVKLGKMFQCLLCKPFKCDCSTLYAPSYYSDENQLEIMKLNCTKSSERRSSTYEYQGPQ